MVDGRDPVLIQHVKICYPPAKFQKQIDAADTSYPGIVVQYDNGFFLIRDGVHRISKFQKNGIFESLFYVFDVNEVDDNDLPESLTLEDGKWVKVYKNRIVTLDVLPKSPIMIMEIENDESS